MQGSVLSRLLGNVYLHHVLDLWIERDVQPRLKGKATLIRYADEFIVGFEREDDTKRVMEACVEGSRVPATRSGACLASASPGAG